MKQNNLKKWQKRLKKEFDDIDKKCVKLDKALTNGAIPYSEVSILQRQLSYMSSYRFILLDRLYKHGIFK